MRSAGHSSLAVLAMDDLPSLHNISFGLNLTSILDYLPSKLLARFMFRSKPAASPTELDLGTLPPSTISDFMATNDWETPLALAAKPQTGGSKTKFTASHADERSLLLGPLGFFTSGYMLGLFLMVSLTLVCALLVTHCLVLSRHIGFRPPPPTSYRNTVSVTTKKLAEAWKTFWPRHCIHPYLSLNISNRPLSHAYKIHVAISDVMPLVEDVPPMGFDYLADVWNLSRNISGVDSGAGSCSDAEVRSLGFA